MIKIDADLLDRLGLGELDAEDKSLMLRHIYDTLEERVGVTLASAMSDPQLDEFEAYFEAKDDAGAFRWLSENFPDYQQIVQDIFKELVSEIESEVPALLQELQEDTTE